MTSADKIPTYRVWRALDADTSYFGIRGRYLFLFLILCAVALAVTSPLWKLLGRLIGTILTAASLIGLYVAIQYIQNLMTSREFERMLAGKRTVRYLKMRPYTLRDHIKSNKISWK